MQETTGPPEEVPYESGDEEIDELDWDSDSSIEPTPPLEPMIGPVDAPVPAGLAGDSSFVRAKKPTFTDRLEAEDTGLVNNLRVQYPAGVNGENAQPLSSQLMSVPQARPPHSAQLDPFPPSYLAACQQPPLSLAYTIDTVFYGAPDSHGVYLMAGALLLAPVRLNATFDLVLHGTSAASTVLQTMMPFGYRYVPPQSHLPPASRMTDGGDAADMYAPQQGARPLQGGPVMPGTVRGPLKRKRDALDSPPIMNPSVAGTNSHHHHRIMQPGETQPAQKKPRLTGRVPDTPFGAQFGPRKLTVNEFLQSPNYWPPLGGRQRNPRLSSHKSVSSTAIAPITGNSVGSAGPLRLDRGQQHRSAGDSTRLPSSLNAYWDRALEKALFAYGIECVQYEWRTTGSDVDLILSPRTGVMFINLPQAEATNNDLMNKIAEADKFYFSLFIVVVTTPFWAFDQPDGRDVSPYAATPLTPEVLNQIGRFKQACALREGLDGQITPALHVFFADNGALEVAAVLKQMMLEEEALQSSSWGVEWLKTMSDLRDNLNQLDEVKREAEIFLVRKCEVNIMAARYLLSDAGSLEGIMSDRPETKNTVWASIIGLAVVDRLNAQMRLHYSPKFIRPWA